MNRINSKTPNEIIEQINSLDAWDFDGELGNLIERLGIIHKEALEEGYNKVWIDCCGNDSYSIMGTRKETTAEVKHRLRKYERNKKNKENLAKKKETRERELYLKLKEKFE